jgi:hypothetical protein
MSDAQRRDGNGTRIGAAIEQASTLGSSFKMPNNGWIGMR